MQFRELGASELDAAYGLLKMVRIDLNPDAFATFINTHSPHTYRPLGAFEQGELTLYAGVSVHENLELGRYLLIDDFVAREGDESIAADMFDFLGDYAKMHQCRAVVLWGSHRGIKLKDLAGFRPKRDGFIKTV